METKQVGNCFGPIKRQGIYCPWNSNNCNNAPNFSNLCVRVYTEVSDFSYLASSLHELMRYVLLNYH